MEANKHGKPANDVPLQSFIHHFLIDFKGVCRGFLQKGRVTDVADVDGLRKVDGRILRGEGAFVDKVAAELLSDSRRNVASSSVGLWRKESQC